MEIPGWCAFQTQLVVGTGGAVASCSRSQSNVPLSKHSVECCVSPPIVLLSPSVAVPGRDKMSRQLSSSHPYPVMMKVPPTNSSVYKGGVRSQVPPEYLTPRLEITFFATIPRVVVGLLRSDSRPILDGDSDLHQHPYDVRDSMMFDGESDCTEVGADVPCMVLPSHVLLLPPALASRSEGCSWGAHDDEMDRYTNSSTEPLSPWCASSNSEASPEARGCEWLASTMESHQQCLMGDDLSTPFDDDDDLMIWFSCEKGR